MYFNSTDNLWSNWADGEYYDSTAKIWRLCNGSCNQQCSYQNHCFDWPLGESFDAQSLSWVTEWNSTTIQIESSLLNLPSIWRGFDYYVDPFSDELIELGTLLYPYKSMRAVITEVINFFSHTDSNITIYTKDVYLEDDTAKFINLTSVNFKSHPKYIVNKRRASLIPTKNSLNCFSEKSLFHLLNSTDINIKNIISLGDFTDKEKMFFNRELISLLYVRTSVLMEDINIYREESSPESSQYFIVAVNLQHKLAKWGMIYKKE